MSSMYMDAVSVQLERSSDAEVVGVLANSREQALGAADTGHGEGGIFSKGEEGAGGREVKAAPGHGGGGGVGLLGPAV